VIQEQATSSQDQISNLTTYHKNKRPALEGKNSRKYETDGRNFVTATKSIKHRHT
jgi:hypothetical protein